MTEIRNPQVDRAYGAKTREQSEEAYDDWAKQYEADLFSYGFRVPIVAATVWSRFVTPNDGPILDAGCGTGLQAEPLYLAGYEPITGIDLSSGMLDIARKKNIYSELHGVALGEKLSFDANSFANTITVGTITRGHAPPHSFDELIRVTRKGGLIVFSLRVDDGQDPAYPAAIAEYEKENRWKMVYQTDPFIAMPLGEPDVSCRVFVYRII